MRRSWPVAGVTSSIILISSLLGVAVIADPALATPGAWYASASSERSTDPHAVAAAHAVPPAVAPAAVEPAAVAPAEERLAPSGRLDQLLASALRREFESIMGPETPSSAGAQGTAPAAEQPAPAPAIDADGRTPSGWLTPVKHYWLSAHFGDAGSWSSGHHTGLDFVAPEGAPLRAPVDGVVVAAGPAGAYGNLLQVRIGRGVELWFAHLGQFTVGVGDHVRQGQLLGRVGMTGRTTGPHSHFEVRVRGKARNPERYFWPGGNAAQRH